MHDRKPCKEDVFKCPTMSLFKVLAGEPDRAGRRAARGIFFLYYYYYYFFFRSALMRQFCNAFVGADILRSDEIIKSDKDTAE